MIHKVNDDGGRIIKQNFWEIVENSKVTVWNTLNGKTWPDGQERVVERAKSRLGRSSYNALTDNCEHFAMWCFNGTKKSEQAIRKSVAVTYGTMTTAAAGALAIGSGPVGAVLAVCTSLASWWTTGKLFHAD
ncbi:hypothetical protein V1264_009828 [Littorina saxatilis]|uniref:LRAT domain-containing protein n=2 Tax=Littorina saxatilis TaxID=31220 RepID=A0AAN9AN43_9CAEN